MYGFNRSFSHTIVATGRCTFFAQRASSGLLLRRLSTYLARLPFSDVPHVCASAIFVDVHHPNRMPPFRVGADSEWVQLRLLGQRFSVPAQGFSIDRSRYGVCHIPLVVRRHLSVVGAPFFGLENAPVFWAQKLAQKTADAYFLNKRRPVFGHKNQPGFRAQKQARLLVAGHQFISCDGNPQFSGATHWFVQA